ncbi:hypothetical protein SLEP1_g48496 [Rubroshorea leprosula]|uniref:Uncharacterized protein n=1 Tax=Rubroshorea leprosula TaxID=152421 RepID=A0AAV5LWU2_9ROSI|nr:hypothetical protein SLEP1_g48496 [Rubroshorea leprosula]
MSIPPKYPSLTPATAELASPPLGPPHLPVLVTFPPPGPPYLPFGPPSLLIPFPQLGPPYLPFSPPSLPIAPHYPPSLIDPRPVLGGWFATSKERWEVTLTVTSRYLTMILPQV